MLLLVIAVCATIIPALARPEPPVQGQDSNTPIPIVNQSGETKEDGSFTYNYETGNGIKVEESGYTKANPLVEARSGAQQGQDEEDNTVIQVLQGTFTYTAPDGQIITLRYIADENGFKPEGDHLPTAPPVPEDIAKSLQSQDQQSGAAQPQQ